MNLFQKSTRLALVMLPLLAGACDAQNQRASRFAPPAAETMTKVNVYKDGTYTARGWYGSLPSSITVTVTLRGGLITAVKVQPHATNPTSLDLQKKFAAAVPAVVIGKPVAQVKVGKLAGSSGTPQGFNDALERIKEEANSN